MPRHATIIFENHASSEGGNVMDSDSCRSMDAVDALWSQHHAELLPRLSDGDNLSSSEDEDGFKDENHVGVEHELSERRSHSYIRFGKMFLTQTRLSLKTCNQVYSWNLWTI